MAMNISKIGGAAQPPADPTLSKSDARKDTASPVGPAVKPAEVKLSPLSEKLKMLASEYAASTAFDSKKVDALKDAIANGTFKVNAEVVADKMIAEAGELNGKKS